jgi:hypothetical protein
MAESQMRTFSRECVTKPDCGISLLKLMYNLRRNTAPTGYKLEVLFHLSEHVRSPVREQEDSFFRLRFPSLSQLPSHEIGAYRLLQSHLQSALGGCFEIPSISGYFRP